MKLEIPADLYFYPRGRREACRLDVPVVLEGAGRVVLLRGNNGVGKTSLLRYLYQNNEDVSYLPEILSFPGFLRTSEILRLYGRPASEGREMMAPLAVEEGRYDQLSKGNRQKLAVRVFMENAIVLRSRAILLDEPTSGLDQVSQCVLWKILTDFAAQRTDRLVVVVSHEYMSRSDALIIDLESYGQPKGSVRYV